jgi:hypothetical protein
MFVSIIAVGILLLIAAAFVGILSANVRASRRIGMPPAPPRAIFNGVIHLAAGGPARFLAGKGAGGGGGCLELFTWGIRLRGYLQLTAPVLEVRYAEIQDMQLVDGQFGRRGIRVRSKELPAPVTFVTSQNQEIAKLLQARGVPISRETREISRETGQEIAAAFRRTPMDFSGSADASGQTGGRDLSRLADDARDRH